MLEEKSFVFAGDRIPVIVCSQALYRLSYSSCRAQIIVTVNLITQKREFQLSPQFAPLSTELEFTVSCTSPLPFETKLFFVPLMKQTGVWL
jgi:hypothetical protein